MCRDENTCRQTGQDKIRLDKSENTKESRDSSKVVKVIKHSSESSRVERSKVE